MATADSLSLPDRTDHPLATEFALVVAATIGFYLAFHSVTAATFRLLDLAALPGGLLVEGLLQGTVLLVVVGLLVGAYATRRGIEIGLTLPTREDLPAIVATVAVPVLLVGLTALVSVATGASYSSLANASYVPDVALWPVAVVVGLGLFVGVPSYLLFCQVLVQGSFERVLGGDVAVTLTTATTGFLLVGTGGGTELSPFPDRGRLVGAVLFVLAVGVALYGANRTDRRWVQYLSMVPALAFVVAVGVSATAAVASPTGALFAGTQLVVLGLAAVTYEQTDSLVVPAFAYLSFALAHDAVVFAFEMGLAGL